MLEVVKSQKPGAECRKNQDVSKATNPELIQPAKLLDCNILVSRYTLDHMLMLIGFPSSVW